MILIFRRFASVLCYGACCSRRKPQVHEQLEYLTPESMLREVDSATITVTRVVLHRTG